MSDVIIHCSCSLDIRIILSRTIFSDDVVDVHCYVLDVGSLVSLS